jgi:hypothetical protein
MKRSLVNRRLVTMAILLPVLVTSCVHNSGRVNAAYSPRLSTADSARSRTTENDAARLFSVPLLNAVQLPPETREIRLSSWYSMMAGEPTPVLRLFQSPREVTGELWRIWIERQGYRGRIPATRCTAWVDSLRTCGTNVFIAPSSWRVIADSMVALHAWTITTRCETDGVLWLDAGDLNITRLQASEFSRYCCNAPERRRSTEAGQAAARLSDYFAQVVRQLTAKGAS